MTGWVRFKATKMAPSELAPGDLFSIEGPDYWETERSREGIGAMVYIYTGRKPLENDNTEYIYHISIQRPPYPFCSTPEKCTESGRCERDICCAD